MASKKAAAKRRTAKATTSKRTTTSRAGPKRTTKAKSRSEISKRGWETRRKAAAA